MSTLKIGTIGDIHEKDCWKKIVNDNPDIKIWVLLGDYVDSWTHDYIKCVKNLEEIIEFKKSNPENIKLLLGNHDFQYMYYPEYRCSGFQEDSLPDLQFLFNENKKLFQIAYEYKDYLFTHAGVSTKWYNKYKKRLEEYSGVNDGGTYSLVDCLNNINETKDRWILAEVGTKRGGMRGDYGGPLWADKYETLEGIIPGYYQVCGHTPNKVIEKVTKFMGTEYTDRSITYCDVLDKDESQFLTLNL